MSGLPWLRRALITDCRTVIDRRRLLRHRAFPALASGLPVGEPAPRVAVVERSADGALRVRFATGAGAAVRDFWRHPDPAERAEFPLRRLRRVRIPPSMGQACGAVVRTSRPVRGPVPAGSGCGAVVRTSRPVRLPVPAGSSRSCRSDVPAWSRARRSALPGRRWGSGRDERADDRSSRSVPRSCRIRCAGWRLDNGVAPPVSGVRAGCALDIRSPGTDGAVGTTRRSLGRIRKLVEESVPITISS